MLPVTIFAFILLTNTVPVIHDLLRSIPTFTTSVSLFGAVVSRILEHSRALAVFIMPCAFLTNGHRILRYLFRLSVPAHAAFPIHCTRNVLTVPVLRPSCVLAFFRVSNLLIVICTANATADAVAAFISCAGSIPTRRMGRNTILTLGINTDSRLIIRTRLCTVFALRVRTSLFLITFGTPSYIFPLPVYALGMLKLRSVRNTSILIINTFSTLDVFSHSARGFAFLRILPNAILALSNYAGTVFRVASLHFAIATFPADVTMTGVARARFPSSPGSVFAIFFPIDGCL